ncbi:MAG: hypothetical protein P4L28_05725 [Paludibacteraceae bacterium]|nr:hypothetical protein [Paludibacteraceae bacterium]
MKRILFIALLVGIEITCLAQNEDWLPGFIIKNQGDTISGLIENKGSRSCSQYCNFKKTETDEPRQFLPSDIQGYRYKDGKFFVSKNISDSKSSKNSKLSRLVFLEYLIHGKINMYHYLSNDDHYYVEKNGDLLELKSTDITSENFGNVTILGERKDYIPLLSYLMQDANIDSTDIQETELDAKSLIKIAEEYHNKVCTNEKCIVYEKKIKPMHVAFSLQMGLTSNKFDITDYTVTDYSTSGLIGCRAEFQNAFVWVRNISFSVDANLQYFSNYNLKGGNSYSEIYYGGPDIQYNNTNYHLSDYYVSDGGTVNKLKADASALKVNLKTWALVIPVTVNYTFSKKKLKPYIGAGLSNMFILSSNDKFVYTVSEYYYGRSLPLYSIGFNGRAGCKYPLKDDKAIYLEFNFQYMESMLDRPQFNLYTKLFSLDVGYTF